MLQVGFAPAERKLPKIVGCDTDGFVPKTKYPEIFGIPVGCDLPEQGGIGGNMHKKSKSSCVCYFA